MTSVQNQDNYGSCWAFSAIGVMEGAIFVKGGELLKLSEQQCVDCVIGDGCNGGWQYNYFKLGENDHIKAGFRHILRSGDQVVLEDTYPYTAYEDDCWAPYEGNVTVKSYTNVPNESVDQLKAAIAKQPVAVTISAGHYTFQHYFEGIITDDACGVDLDHAVLAVGYGTEDGVDYYIVKNSWGNKWGESGYVRIAAVDGKGICGIQQLSLYPQTD